MIKLLLLHLSAASKLQEQQRAQHLLQLPTADRNKK
jgi:hypothetical protein